MRSSLLVLVVVSQVVLQVVSQLPFSSTSCHNGYAICHEVDPNGFHIAPPLDQQASLMQPGRHIQRGPNWHYGDEDGGNGSVGEVLDWNTGSQFLFWVHWPNGNDRIYVMQGGRGRVVGTFDIMFSQDEVDSLDDCWNIEGNKCADGEQCGNADSGNCAYRTCSAGYFYDCTCANQNSGQLYSKCCVLEGQLYPHGRYNDFCAPLQCTTSPDRDDGFWFWQGYINNNCKTCKAYMDPHVKTFDEQWFSYAYQGCGEYSMAQQGVSYSPEFGVFSKFNEYCGGYGVSCVSAAIMQQDDIQVIAKSPPNDDQVFVTVDGIDYNVSDFNVSVLPMFVPLDGNDKVLAWIHNWGETWSNSNCVFFQGTKGLLIQFCGNKWVNSLNIWAMPDLHGEVNGLCGSLNNDVSDDYTTRQGTLLEYSTDYYSASRTEWATSWLTVPNSSTNCPSLRMHVRAKESCQDFDIYEEQCNDTVSRLGSHLLPPEIQDLIAACAFDLCNVDDPNGYLDGAVAETVKIQDNVEKVSISITSPDGCGQGFESIGDECFKRISNLTTDWETARLLCQAEGLFLAEPWDIKAVSTHLKENYDDLFYWLGGRGDGAVSRWLSGGEVSSTEPWMKRHFGVSGDPDRCLDIVTYGNWPARGEMLAAGHCNGTWPRAALCSLTRRPAQ